MSDELVEVWRQPDGSWRWRYRVVEDHRELRSNRGYDSLEEAVVSARLAYPRVQVLAPAGDRAALDGSPRREGRWLRIVVVSALATFALLAWWAAVGRARRRGSRRR